MPFEHIRQLDIKNYGCIKEASFRLMPLQALIGPNDSGKSTILRALRTVAEATAEKLQQTKTFDPRMGTIPDVTSLTVRFHDNIAYSIQSGATPAEFHESAFRDDGTSSPEWKATLRQGAPGPGSIYKISATPGTPTPGASELRSALKARTPHATVIRFDPNALREPSRQLLGSEPIQFLAETGTGLAGVYQAINSRDVDAFVAVRDRVRKLFPTIQNILVPTVESSQVTIEAKLTDNTTVPVAALSEGLLYFLGFMALQYLGNSGIFLVEEPENGLHPARISEVMAILREISKTNQVIIATHSPLVVNEMRGEEISVVTRDPDTGTQVKLLKDVPGFADALKVYQPGEFWVSYCDGKQEEPLLTGSPRS